MEVWLGNPATGVSEAGIAFKDGRFVPSRTVVWAAGVRPSPLTAALDVERGRDGRLVVDEHLRLPSHPEAFALGDCAWSPIPEEGGRPAPPNAQTAVGQAPVVAANVVASLTGASPRPFRYANEGNLVALGQGDGVAVFGQRHLAGFPAWLAWRGFYLTQLMGFKNRLSMLVEWASAYFGHRVTSRLDVSETMRPCRRVGHRFGRRIQGRPRRAAGRAIPGAGGGGTSDTAGGARRACGCPVETPQSERGVREGSNCRGGGADSALAVLEQRSGEGRRGCVEVDTCQTAERNEGGVGGHGGPGERDGCPWQQEAGVRSSCRRAGRRVAAVDGSALGDRGRVAA